MKNFFLFSLLAVLVSHSQWAQTPSRSPGYSENPPAQGARTSPLMSPPQGTGKITGNVLDSASRKAVEFATVALVSSKTKKPIDGAVCDEKGRFVLNQVAAGTYTLSVTFVGYRNYVSAPFTVEEKGTSIQIPVISLQSDIQTLKEVTIVGEKALIEDKVDRLVYNAEKDITSIGGNAADVLRKVPMLSVDLDGNVQMRGSSNITVLINNKPSSIMAGNLADALRQIPAEMIKSVEVITSPSARYDAEGSAGIINIITKKNDMQGITGAVNTSAGNRGSNASGNLNYRKNKFGLNTSLGLNANYLPSGGETARTDFLDGGRTNVFQQNSTGHTLRLFNNAQVGFDYDITPKSSLNGSVRWNQSGFLFSNLWNASYQSPEEVLQKYTRDISSKNLGSNWDFNAGYVKTFQKTGQELSVLGLFTQSNRNEDFKQTQTNALPQEEEVLQKSNNLNINREATLQIDYTHPIQDNQVLETGVKGILRKADSDFDFFNYIAQAYVLNTSRSNVLNYTQNVGASYLSYTYNIPKKWSLKLGTRYEFTQVDGKFMSIQDTMFAQRYGTLIPSIAIARDLKDGQKLKVSYNRRIQRPSIRYLNPYVDYSDPRNITFGNPYLDPELTDNYEISYSALFKNHTLTVSAYTRRTNNSIEQVRNLNDNSITESTYQNISKNATYGTTIYGSTKPIPNWTLSGTVTLLYVTLNSPALATSNANWQYNFNLNSAWKFNKGWSVQFFGFFNSPRIELQGKRASFSFYNIAARKEIMKKKGTIGLGLDNPFTGVLKLKTTTNTQTFAQTDQRNIYLRGIRASFSYQFGKIDFNSRKKKDKSINNDDLKQGDDDNGGGGSGRPSGRQ